MPLSQVDRMSALILAKTISTSNVLLDVMGELPGYLRRLHSYKLFTVIEIGDIANRSEYAVRKAITGEEEFRARTGIKARHLDHLIRMVGSPAFAKLHTKSLIADGATIAGLARVSGLSETSLRRWAEEEK